MQEHNRKCNADRDKANNYTISFTSTTKAIANTSTILGNMLVLLVLLLSALPPSLVGAADVNAILASAVAGDETIYGTGQCVAPWVTGATARDCGDQQCYLDLHT